MNCRRRVWEMQRSKTIARVSFVHPSPTAWWYTNLVTIFCHVLFDKNISMKISTNKYSCLEIVGKSRLGLVHRKAFTEGLRGLTFNWLCGTLPDPPLSCLSLIFFPRTLSVVRIRREENRVSDQTTDGAFPGCLYRVWPSRPDPRDPDLRQSPGLPQPNRHGAPQKKCAIRRIRYPTLTKALF